MNNIMEHWWYYVDTVLGSVVCWRPATS